MDLPNWERGKKISLVSLFSGTAVESIEEVYKKVHPKIWTPGSEEKSHAKDHGKCKDRGMTVHEMPRGSETPAGSATQRLPMIPDFWELKCFALTLFGRIWPLAFTRLVLSQNKVKSDETLCYLVARRLLYNLREIPKRNSSKSESPPIECDLSEHYRVAARLSGAYIELTTPRGQRENLVAQCLLSNNDGGIQTLQWRLRIEKLCVVSNINIALPGLGGGVGMQFDVGFGRFLSLDRTIRGFVHNGELWIQSAISPGVFPKADCESRSVVTFNPQEKTATIMVTLGDKSKSQVDPKALYILIMQHFVMTHMAASRMYHPPSYGQSGVPTWEEDVGAMHHAGIQQLTMGPCMCVGSWFTQPPEQPSELQQRLMLKERLLMEQSPVTPY
ncbi:hypothetical protein B0H11DRAFT_1902323 [Mycena galericulata]|nr:hypothetical protein B0H11DRAFT_1902323 [Mycena galericulata]